ncbi:unnamed protein product (macronuclear) [Paramecium tetraurelia]|uniref:Uncharacterized protein n=1 Tax=Paramecium tetraurelia TaxID=5888 RepID=A0CA07_PARTE|nr:uncharacterized protein GSPATT00036403001 [Paramecium tetraurelia]CAK67624.1 unnamed protein product [Paramecium tetraurelia]|eukprot:XP_001435021.1 hypothetical protein (macronuclear) [Paramecium tetraurelia strain d4-2]
MLNQYATPPRIPKPSPIPQNQEQLLHVVLHERQIQQQQRYYTPQLIRPPSQQTLSTQLNSPISNQPKQQRYSVMQQVNQNDMNNQYQQIMQYYKELEINMLQQKQENYLKYNEILQKIDNIQQLMANNINQLNINQRNEYQQLLQELQQQRLENQQRYEQLFYNIEQQKDQNHYEKQLQQREQLFQQQHQIIEQQKQQLYNQNANINKPSQQQPIYYDSNPSNLEQKLFPQEQNSQDQLNYSQIHNRSNKQLFPSIQIPHRNQSQDNNTFGINSGQITPYIQGSPQQPNNNLLQSQEQYNPNSNRQFMNNQMSNQIIKQTKSPREQISPCICINSPKNTSRDNSISHQKKIFEKPVFEQVHNKPLFHQNPPIKNQDHHILNQSTQQQQYYQVQQPFHSDESIIIDESKNTSEFLQYLKAEYGINSLIQNSSLQLVTNQLQLIYCLSCDQYISLQLSDQHLQVCNPQRPQRRQNDSYLDKYIVYRGDDFFIETLEAKMKRICQEILQIKLMMQLAQQQKWTTYEYIQLREFCQVAITILDRLLSNPNSYQLHIYYQHTQQIFNIVYMAPQIFYKQQAKLLQKCLDRVKDLQLLHKK